MAPDESQRTLDEEATRRVAEAFAREMLPDGPAAEVAGIVAERDRSGEVRDVRNAVRSIVLQRRPRAAERSVHRYLPPGGMTCTDVLELLDRRAADGVTGRHPRLERHFARCEGCRRAVEQLKAAERAFAAAVEAELAPEAAEAAHAVAETPTPAAATPPPVIETPPAPPVFAPVSPPRPPAPAPEPVGVRNVSVWLPEALRRRRIATPPTAPPEPTPAAAHAPGAWLPGGDRR